MIVDRKPADRGLGHAPLLCADLGELEAHEQVADADASAEHLWTWED